jgi:hypothetical protein
MVTELCPTRSRSQWHCSAAVASCRNGLSVAPSPPALWLSSCTAAAGTDSIGRRTSSGAELSSFFLTLHLITEVGAGTGVVSSGATTCTACGSGTYTASSTVACATCAPGSITEDGVGNGVVSGGATTCTACQAAQFSASPGESCVPCPDGSMSGV